MKYSLRRLLQGCHILGGVENPAETAWLWKRFVATSDLKYHNSNADTKTETNTDTDTDTKADTNIDTNADTNTDTNADTNTDTYKDTNTLN